MLKFPSFQVAEPGGLTLCCGLLVPTQVCPGDWCWGAVQVLGWGARFG